MADETTPAPKAAQAQARADDKAAAADQRAARKDAHTAEREARKAATKGAQVILDPQSDASHGAKGGLEGDIAGNTHARDAHLRSHGLDPHDPDPVDLPANTVPADAGSVQPAAK